MDKKILRNDLILIGSLLIVAILSLVLVLSLRKKNNLQAKVFVQNEVVEVIDLSKKEEQDYYVKVLKTMVHIHPKNGGIAIVESGCPHQDCVNMGYVYETNRPIICAYNAVYIVIEGKPAINDVEI